MSDYTVALATNEVCPSSLTHLPSLAALGTFTLPTSALPEALGYAQQHAKASSSSVEAPLSGTQWKSWTPGREVSHTNMREQ
eukprot:6246754-Amphidinium_carterae.1